uniref:THIF-type NAD/FAD binding fold domain-containing protein n=1 Tax=Acrobeloides nanus TaxID=290746 RepID=A0A914D9U3_9BILA
RALASEKRTRDLNPMVELKIITSTVDEQPEEFFKEYDLVILIDQKYDMINKVNKICRKEGIRFQSGGVFGWNGYAFFDFNNHIFLLPKPKPITIAETLDDDASGPSPKKMKSQSSVEAVTLEDEEDQKIKKVFIRDEVRLFRKLCVLRFNKLKK